MDGPLFMDSLVASSPPFTGRGFVALISALTAINAASAATYFWVGARVTPLFIVLDLAAVVVAFAAGVRSASRRERVQVSAAEVRVVLETRQGATTLWTSPTAFTQVALVGESEKEADLRLRLSGREMAVGRGLSRRDRLQFRRTLDAAIVRARTGRLIG